MKNLNHYPNDVLKTKNQNETPEAPLADEVFLNPKETDSISIDGEYLSETWIPAQKLLLDFEIF